MVDDDYVVDDIMFDDEDEQPVQPVTTKVEPQPTPQPAQMNTQGLNLDPTASLSVKSNKSMYDEIEKQEREMGDAPIDFSRLNDPSYTPVVERFMKLKRRKSNMMTLEEFNRFRPIFDPKSTMNSQDKQNLFVAWQHRVSLRDPVEVYDRGDLVLIIPPVFAEVNSISEVGHNVVSGIIDGFYNANQLDFDINNRQQHWGNKMIQAFQYAQSQNNLDEQSRIAELLAKQALGVAEDAPETQSQDSTVSNNNNVPSHTRSEVEDELVDDEYL